MKTKYQLLIIITISFILLVLVAGLALSNTTGLSPLVPDVSASTQIGPVPAQTTTDLPRAITVVGEGQVSTTPDIAQVNIGVEIINSDVQQASSEAAQTMETLLNTLTAQGVAERDIQTSYYNVWVERPYSGPQGGPAGETLYHVNNNVMVTIRDLEQVTDILGAALEAGANNINSVNFKVADPSELRTEARQLAVDNALASAQELAAMNGGEVGEVINISEIISQGAYYVSELASSADGLGGGGAGPISPGEVQVLARLQITYELK